MNILESDAVTNEKESNRFENRNAELEIIGEKSVAIESLYTFAIAIGLHCLMDGFAIGVFKDPKEIAVLTASIVVHKIPVAYTVGITFMK